ncbi:hypothetical protein [Rhodanobacter sp. L36]|uniref:hypothetical protein n=1 Tax=Rhodanobacter sp. L36 TaxID=1747221 RepID=UPI00131AAA8A|nr:hypothetical protein [Rhodanobacter sp. L36]
MSGDSAQSANIAPHENGSEIRLALPDGQLVGINGGEFGGRIEWIGQDGVRRVVVPDKNPVAFTTRGNDIFVATGLFHMGIDSGEIIKLRRTGSGTWQVSTVMNLDEAPDAGARIDDATWMLLTTHGLTQVDLIELTKEPIYRNENWKLLWANSVRPLGDSWLVGARRAVIEITPRGGTFEEKWLIPASCRRLKTFESPDCECRP